MQLLRKLIMKFFLILTLFIFSMKVLAGHPDTMRACGNIAFTKNRDLNICMKSGAEADAIIACSKIDTMDMSLVNQCITSGADKDKINNCVRKTDDANDLNTCLKS